MDREIPSELFENPEGRWDSYVREWLNDAEFRASLHRYDRDQHEADPEGQRA
jgi:hypothetical protein